MKLYVYFDYITKSRQKDIIRNLKNIAKKQLNLAYPHVMKKHNGLNAYLVFDKPTELPPGVTLFVFTKNRNRIYNVNKYKVLWKYGISMYVLKV